MKQNVLGLICARGGSKGVPRKNVRLLGGKPLIAHSIEAGLASGRLDRLIVSTDDPEIAETARAHGADIPFMRPAELATDTAPEWLAWRHALESVAGESGGGRPDVLVVLPATSPLRTPEDVRRAVDLYQAGSFDGVIAVTEAARNPYFNMVRREPDGSVRLVVEPDTPIHRRQDAPACYDITTVVYVMRPEYVLAAPRLFAGRIGAVLVDQRSAVDIDTEMDFRFAEFLMQEEGRNACAR